MCEIFGPILDLDLIMDPNNSKLSIGKGFVTFELLVDAESFVQSKNEKSFEGRLIRVAFVQKRHRTAGGIKGTGGSSKKQIGCGGPARYWEKDISTRCHRCGGIGHIAASCTNDEKPRLCHLCGKTGHDGRQCPFSRICFNCGIPGHINRECTKRRGMPKRVVCGECFMTGHHRWNCRESRDRVPTYNAICSVCGQKGHFMCKEMRWFFGLQGLSCFNCGESGHHGMHCDRPGIDTCVKDLHIGIQEIDRAEIFSINDELTTKLRTQNDNDESAGRWRDHNEGQGKKRQEGRGGGSRAKSQPPQGDHRGQYQASTFGRINVGSGLNNERGGQHRRPPPPPPQMQPQQLRRSQHSRGYA